MQKIKTNIRFVREKSFSPWRVVDACLLVLIVFLGVHFWQEATSNGSLPKEWQWGKISNYIAWQDHDGWHMGLLTKGFLTTLRLGIWAGLVALLVGVSVGVRLTSKRKSLGNYLLYSIVVFLRNTPPLVLLFLLYFLASEQTVAYLGEWARQASPPVQDFLSITFATPDAVDKMLAAVLTLGLYQGAYVAEIVRGGLQGLPQGQWDAAAALGFSRWQQFRKVLLPQALPSMLPPLAGQYVSVFKDSALASLISVPELTFQGMEVMAITRRPFESWVLVAALYLGISLVCTRLFQRLENKLVWHKARSV